MNEEFWKQDGKNVRFYFHDDRLLDVHLNLAAKTISFLIEKQKIVPLTIDEQTGKPKSFRLEFLKNLTLVLTIENAPIRLDLDYFNHEILWCDAQGDRFNMTLVGGDISCRFSKFELTDADWGLFDSMEEKVPMRGFEPPLGGFRKF